MRSRKHRWLERGLAFGGLAYWLLTSYGALAFAAALVTSLTTASVVRILAELGVVSGAFGALIAHRWRPRAARAAHWVMLGSAVVVFGSCGEMIELPPRYQSFDYRGVRVEFADDGVAHEAPKIRDLIDQVYERSGMPLPSPALRMRFMKNTGGRLLQLGDWSDAGAGGAEIALTTDRGATRGSSFLLEGSFLLAEALARRAAPDVQTGARDGFAYWTMLGVTPQPEWARKYLDGTLQTSCAGLEVAGVPLAGPGELTIWLGDSQRKLHLDSLPFIAVDRAGGVETARAAFTQASTLDRAAWLATVGQHCSSAP